MSERLFVLLVSTLCAVTPAASVTSASNGEAPARILAIVSLVEGEAKGPDGVLELFTVLEPGDRISTGSDARIRLGFESGRRFEVGPGTEAEIAVDALRVLEGTARELEPVSALPPVLSLTDEELTARYQGATRIRGGGPIGEMYPARGARALASSTQLSFARIEGIEQYRIEVRDVLGHTAFQAKSRDGAVDVPAGALRSDEQYTWWVHTVDDALPSVRGEASFYTLTRREAESREALAERVAGDPTVDKLLLLAELDRRLGLLAEACRGLLRARETAAPPTPPIASWSFCDALPRSIQGAPTATNGAQ